MIYLVVLVVAASVAIGRLWLMQRRERSHIQTVNGFRTGLERLAEPTAPAQGSRRVAGHPASGSHRPSGTSSNLRPAKAQELDPARRAAAKRRIEARRKAMRARAAS